VAMLGLALAACAIFAGPWPSDPALPVSGFAVSHLDRAQGKQALPAAGEPDRDAGWYFRRAFDAAVYGLLGVGMSSVFVMIRYGLRSTLAGLAFTGVVGTFYSAALGMYIGPILAMSGFALVFFGAVLGWLTGDKR
jgi:hypothetical protein